MGGLGATAAPLFMRSIFTVWKIATSLIESPTASGVVVATGGVPESLAGLLPSGETTPPSFVTSPPSAAAAPASSVGPEPKAAVSDELHAARKSAVGTADKSESFIGDSGGMRKTSPRTAVCKHLRSQCRFPKSQGRKFQSQRIPRPMNARNLFRPPPPPPGTPMSSQPTVREEIPPEELTDLADEDMEMWA